MLNKCVLCGRICKDPEVRFGDTMVAKYSLAVDRKYSKDKETDFINCVCFGKTAEFAEKYLKKGTKILIVGRIQTGSYEKDGKKVYTTDIVVEEHEFCESRATNNDSTESKKDDGEFMHFDGEQTTLPF